MQDSISKLSELLSSPEGAEKIKGLLGALSGSDDSADLGSSLPVETKAPPLSEKNSGELELMAKVSSIMSQMSDKNDSRIALLHSLKPFLRPSHISRLDSAVRLLQITKLSSILTNKEGML